MNTRILTLSHTLFLFVPRAIPAFLGFLDMLSKTFIGREGFLSKPRKRGVKKQKT